MNSGLADWRSEMHVNFHMAFLFLSDEMFVYDCSSLHFLLLSSLLLYYLVHRRPRYLCDSRSVNFLPRHMVDLKFKKRSLQYMIKQVRVRRAQIIVRYWSEDLQAPR